eukprot:scaffold8486_cov112-Isochrysis_galbana.AAC.1
MPAVQQASHFQSKKPMPALGRERVESVLRSGHRAGGSELELERAGRVVPRLVDNVKCVEVVLAVADRKERDHVPCLLRIGRRSGEGLLVGASVDKVVAREHELVRVGVEDLGAEHLLHLVVAGVAPHTVGELLVGPELGKVDGFRGGDLAEGRHAAGDVVGDVERRVPRRKDVGRVDGALLVEVSGAGRRLAAPHPHAAE